MKISEYIKQNGILKICEKCNYDIRDIRLNLLRATDLSEKDDSQKSRALKEFKDFIKDAKDNFLIWSRLGMASSIRALYDRKTMLNNADISS